MQKQDPRTKEASLRIAELQKQLKSEVYDTLVRLAQQLVFDKYPFIKSFGFTAYTPAWCDGEACEYSAHLDDPYVNGESCSDQEGFWGRTSDEWYESGKYVPNEKYDPVYAAAAEDIFAVLKTVNEKTYQQLFDEGMIVFTPGKIEVEDYEHDC